jgi:Cu+-exporting ATPase
VVTNALRLRFFKPSVQVPVRESDGPAVPELKGEETVMEKKVIIEGMMCMHCRAHAEKALNGIPGATATVDLESKTAIVTGDVSDDAIRTAIEEAGYQVVSIS